VNMFSFVSSFPDPFVVKAVIRSRV